MTIDELNRKIIVNTFTFSQNGDGGNIKVPADSYSLWANVKQGNSNRTLDNLQIAYNEAYTVTVRVELSRPFYKTNEIVYEGKILSVASIKEIKEGKKDWNEILCYSTGHTINSSES